MANDINNCVFIGNLTRDTELKYTSNGTAVASGTIVSNRKYQDQDQEQVTFIDFKVWGKTAESINPYMLKGKRVCLAGELRQENWEKDGQKHSKLVLNAMSIQLLSPNDSQSPPKPAQATNSKQKPAPQYDFPGPEQFDDDIPF